MAEEEQSSPFVFHSFVLSSKVQVQKLRREPATIVAMVVDTIVAVGRWVGVFDFCRFREGEQWMTGARRGGWTVW